MLAPVISRNIYDVASLHDDSTPSLTPSKMGHIISARAENLVQSLLPPPPPPPSPAELKLSAISESEGRRRRRVAKRIFRNFSNKFSAARRLQLNWTVLYANIKSAPKMVELFFRETLADTLQNFKASL